MLHHSSGNAPLCVCLEGCGPPAGHVCGHAALTTWPVFFPSLSTHTQQQAPGALLPSVCYRASCSVCGHPKSPGSTLPTCRVVRRRCPVSAWSLRFTTTSLHRCMSWMRLTRHWISRMCLLVRCCCCCCYCGWETCVVVVVGGGGWGGRVVECSLQTDEATAS